MGVAGTLQGGHRDHGVGPAHQALPHLPLPHRPTLQHGRLPQATPNVILTEILFKNCFNQCSGSGWIRIQIAAWIRIRIRYTYGSGSSKSSLALKIH